MTIFAINKLNPAKKLTNFVAKYNQTAKLRRAELELLKFDDRMLEDMGMSRGDIHSKVWGQI